MTTENDSLTAPAPPGVPEAAPDPSVESVNLDVNNDVTLDANADSSPAPEVPAETSSTGKVPDGTGKRGAKERIEDLVAEKNAAKEYADYWREKALEVMKAGKTAPATTQQPEPVETVPSVPPTLEEFKYDQKAWGKALAEWNAKQVQVQVQQVLQERDRQASEQSTQAAFQAKIEKFKEDHPDWDILMENPRLPVLDRVASAMVVASDYSADLAYALAKSPDQAVRISRMNPANQALAIGRLEQEIRQSYVKPAPAPEKAPEPKKAVPVKAVSDAPPPPTPIPSGGTPDISPDSMSMAEWVRWRTKTSRQSRGRVGRGN